MSISLYEIRVQQATALLKKFGLVYKVKDTWFDSYCYKWFDCGTYQKGKCTVIIDKLFVRVIYPSGGAYTINLNC